MLSKGDDLPCQLVENVIFLLLLHLIFIFLSQFQYHLNKLFAHHSIFQMNVRLCYVVDNRRVRAAIGFCIRNVRTYISRSCPVQKRVT